MNIFWKLNIKPNPVSLFVEFFPSFPFAIEGRMWDVTGLNPDHRLSIYFVCIVNEI